MGPNGSSGPSGPSGPRFVLIYHNDMVYEGWIDSKFILMHKGIVNKVFGLG